MYYDGRASSTLYRFLGPKRAVLVSLAMSVGGSWAGCDNYRPILKDEMVDIERLVERAGRLVVLSVSRQLAVVRIRSGSGVPIPRPALKGGAKRKKGAKANTVDLTPKRYNYFFLKTHNKITL